MPPCSTSSCITGTVCTAGVISTHDWGAQSLLHTILLISEGNNGNRRWRYRRNNWLLLIGSYLTAVMQALSLLIYTNSIGNLVSREHLWSYGSELRNRNDWLVKTGFDNHRSIDFRHGQGLSRYRAFQDASQERYIHARYIHTSVATEKPFLFGAWARHTLAKRPTRL